MPVGYVQPSLTDVHVNRLLTNISIAYNQAETSYVADQFAPIVQSSEQSGLYASYDKGYFLRSGMTKRAPGAESAGGGYAIDLTGNFSAVVFAFHHDIPDQIRAGTSMPLGPDMEVTKLLISHALINRETSFLSTYMGTGLWTSDFSGVASGQNGTTTFLKWSDPASTPIEDIRASATVVQARTGFRPNVLVLGRQVYDKLLDHPDIVARLDRGQTPVGPALVNRASLAALFELDKILVMDAVANTAKEGATNTIGFIGGKNALLAYVAPQPGLMTPSAAYTFAWTGYLGANSLGTAITRFRMEALKSDRLEIENAYVQKLVAPDLGVYFSGIVA